MTEPDPHAPTSAAPEPETNPWGQPPAATSSLPVGADEPKAEVLIGGALAGGFLAALILKRLGR